MQILHEWIRASYAHIHQPPSVCESEEVRDILDGTMEVDWKREGKETKAGEPTREAWRASKCSESVIHSLMSTSGTLKRSSVAIC